MFSGAGTSKQQHSLLNTRPMPVPGTAAAGWEQITLHQRKTTRMSSTFGRGTRWVGVCLIISSTAVRQLHVYPNLDLDMRLLHKNMESVSCISFQCHIFLVIRHQQFARLRSCEPLPLGTQQWDTLLKEAHQHLLYLARLTLSYT
jgi:hypothetical protein